MKPISAKHARFCLEYMRDGNAAAAYRRSGYAVKNADVNACRLMKRDDVKVLIVELRQEVSVNLKLTAQDIINKLTDIAFADAAELAQIKVLPCKFCETDGPIRDQQPDPTCRECDGLGRYTVYYADTRYLSRRGKALFAGVEQTRSGVKLRLHNSMKALDMLVRIYFGR